MKKLDSKEQHLNSKQAQSKNIIYFLCYFLFICCVIFMKMNSLIILTNYNDVYLASSSGESYEILHLKQVSFSVDNPICSFVGWSNESTLLWSSYFTITASSCTECENASCSTPYVGTDTEKLKQYISSNILLYRSIEQMTPTLKTLKINLPVFSTIQHAQKFLR